MAVLAGRFMCQNENRLQIRSGTLWCLGMHARISKKGTSTQTFQLLSAVAVLSDMLSAELLLLLLDCWRVTRVLAGI